MICDKLYIDVNVKVKFHLHITGKNRGSTRRDFNIKVELNHKFLLIFHNLKNPYSYLVMRQLGKIILK